MRSEAAGWVFAATLLLAGLPGEAGAIDFGPNDAFSLRGRFYSQLTIATENTDPESDGTVLDPAGAVPSRNTGDLVQQRNFMNPELEVDLLALAPSLRGWFDELEGRVALWGFYDGIYDYGPERWRQVLAQYREGELQQVSKATQVALVDGRVEFPAGLYERQARRIYGRRFRVNEAYVDVSKGPVFLRIGRQAMSWGEADTIGLLDANNPFDTTILPGLFLDLEEARIPLWTVRATLELFEEWGPLSGGFLDAYWVPGWLDTTISPLPIQSASPFSVPPPAAGGRQGNAGPGSHVVQGLPEPSTKNSRWGVKLQAFLDYEYSLQAWFYTTFPIRAVPVVYGLDSGNQVVTVLESPLVNVIGVATNWYSEAIDSVIRAEVELFNGEPGFLAYENIGQAFESGFETRGHYDRINMLRGEIGIDYNLRAPFLNQESGFLIVGSIVWFWNTDESADRDYRAGGLVKPSAIRRGQEGGAPAGAYASRYCDDPGDPDIPEDARQCDFVNQDPFGAFAQITVRTDYLQGRLTPQLTTIATDRGALTIAPSLVYRLSDEFLVDLKYITTHTFGSINTGYTLGPGVMRDRDELWVRLVAQLN